MNRLEDYKKEDKACDVIFYCACVVLLLGLFVGTWHDGKKRGIVIATTQCNNEIKKINAELIVVRNDLKSVTSQDVFKKQ